MDAVRRTNQASTFRYFSRRMRSSRWMRLFIKKGLPDYKPVSVPRFLKARRQPFLLARNLFPAPATYPEVVTERAAPAPLFGLAPHGVCPASDRYRRRGALLPHLFTLTRRRDPQRAV